MDLAERRYACHTAVIYDAMKELGRPIRVLPRTLRFGVF